MKTLREMIDLVEAIQTQPSYPVHLDNKYGGGSIDKISSPGSVTVTYTDKSGELEAQVEIKNKQKLWITKQNPNGEPMSSARELIDMFDNYLVKDICHHFDNHLVSQDPRGERVLDLVKKVNPMKESTNNPKTIESIREMLKPIMDDLYAMADRMDKEELEETIEDPLKKIDELFKDR